MCATLLLHIVALFLFERKPQLLVYFLLIYFDYKRCMAKLDQINFFDLYMTVFFTC